MNENLNIGYNSSMRDNYLQLPSIDEVKTILETEADREVPEQNQETHFADFQPIVKLMEAYNIRSETFQKEYSQSEAFDPQNLEKLVHSFNQLLDAILTHEPTDEQKNCLDRSYEYLSEEDEPKSSDIIFVFGSKACFRTDKAIDLFQNGLAPKVMFSGNKSIYEDDDVPQIYKHVEYAKSAGILEEAIIIEDESISVPDNVKSSLNLLERERIKYDRMILVMSPFAQRRGYAHFQKFSTSTEFYRVNSDSSEKYQSDKWFKDEIATRVILNEWAKMRFSCLINTM